MELTLSIVVEGTGLTRDELKQIVLDKLSEIPAQAIGVRLQSGWVTPEWEWVR